MNREIKFRGKLVNSKEWAEGNLYIRVDGTYIITPDETILGKYGKVNKETVGQYTGLHDKNGKEIYEEDVVKITNKNSKVIPIKPLIAQIVWSEEYLAYILITTSVKDAFENLGDYIDYDIEVIGNVFENPELLGGK